MSDWFGWRLSGRVRLGRGSGVLHDGLTSGLMLPEMIGPWSEGVIRCYLEPWIPPPPGVPPTPPFPTPTITTIALLSPAAVAIMPPKFAGLLYYDTLSTRASSSVPLPAVPRKLSIHITLLGTTSPAGVGPYL